MPNAQCPVPSAQKKVPALPGLMITTKKIRLDLRVRERLEKYPVNAGHGIGVLRHLRHTLPIGMVEEFFPCLIARFHTFVNRHVSEPGQTRAADVLTKEDRLHFYVSEYVQLAIVKHFYLAPDGIFAITFIHPQFEQTLFLRKKDLYERPKQDFHRKPA